MSCSLWDSLGAAARDDDDRMTQRHLRHRAHNYNKLLRQQSIPKATPVIGVLAQPYNGTTTHEYIAASYIKWLEGAGARTIVIPYQPQSTAVLDDILSQIHMVFLPGGEAAFPKQMLFYLLDRIRQINQEPVSYFPVWGTCLGFEFLMQYAAARLGQDERLVDSVLDSDFVADNRTWSLYNVTAHGLYAEPEIYKIVATTNTTFNNHHQGITPIAFANHGLAAWWHVTSLNHDDRGKTFVSTVEPANDDLLPWYGTQYHPEKNTYEYAMYPHTNIPYEDIDHSPTGIQFSQHLAQFVVQSLARRSVTANPTRQYTKTNLYPPVFTYPMALGYHGFEQVYVIPSAASSTASSSSATTSRRGNPSVES
mmetsp:Transcript_26118/g.71989  ORF Transcript_26118/g.71989 Transcript_26118/m.71989 type:complete len:366 (-) Transcript_26118:144-1241(-)